MRVRTEFEDAVEEAFTSVPKTISPRFFYDEAGSLFFEEITRQPEYYLTRSEQELLDEFAPQMIEECGTPIEIVELGSGSSKKTRTILEAALSAGEVTYKPIDISESFLMATTEKLQADYPELRVEPMVGAYESALRSLSPSVSKRLFLFLGSSIGNFEPEAAVGLFRSVASGMKPDDRFLVGFDYVKNLEQLLPAYDDPAGATESFNKNILARINREMGADFDLDDFTHYAPYVPLLERIEMHLVAKRDLCADIPALGIKAKFEEGETLHTSCSHKYTDKSIERLYEESGLKRTRSWFHRQNRYGLVMAGLK
ncbi:MAG: L-histidine N(alpha)-methyltransferase [Fimbriimonadaceae bacterium]